MEKLAIDIDDTLNCSFVEGNLTARIMASEEEIQYEYDPTKEDEVERFGFTEEQKHRYLVKYFPNQVKNCNVLPYAIKCLNILKNHYELFLMTARDPNRDREEEPYKGKFMVQDTKLWVKKNHIPIEENHMLFGIKEKGLVCKQLGFSVLIDNSPKHIQSAIDNGIKPIMIGYPYNLEFYHTHKDDIIYLYDKDGISQWKQLYLALIKNYN